MSFPLFIDPAAHQGALTSTAMGTVISSCTLFYGTLLLLTGSAATKRLARNRHIATFASKMAGMFLIGFGIKLTTN